MKQEKGLFVNRGSFTAATIKLTSAHHYLVSFLLFIFMCTEGENMNKRLSLIQTHAHKLFYALLILTFLSLLLLYSIGQSSETAPIVIGSGSSYSETQYQAALAKCNDEECERKACIDHGPPDCGAKDTQKYYRDRCEKLQSDWSDKFQKCKDACGVFATNNTKGKADSCYKDIKECNDKFEDATSFLGEGENWAQILGQSVSQMTGQGFSPQALSGLGKKCYTLSSSDYQTQYDSLQDRLKETETSINDARRQQIEERKQFTQQSLDTRDKLLDGTHQREKDSLNCEQQMLEFETRYRMNKSGQLEKRRQLLASKESLIAQQKSAPLQIKSQILEELTKCQVEFLNAKRAQRADYRNRAKTETGLVIAASGGLRSVTSGDTLRQMGIKNENGLEHYQLCYAVARQKLLIQLQALKINEASFKRNLHNVEAQITQATEDIEKSYQDFRAQLANEAKRCHLARSYIEAKLARMREREEALYKNMELSLNNLNMEIQQGSRNIQQVSMELGVLAQNGTNTMSYDKTAPQAAQICEVYWEAEDSLNHFCCSEEAKKYVTQPECESSQFKQRIKDRGAR